MAEYFTVYKKPLIRTRTPGTANPTSCAEIDSSGISVRLAIKRGIEIQLESAELANPSSDCWFVVRLPYVNRQRKDGTPDYDIIITNGEEYFLCRRSLGESPFVLDEETECIINTSINGYVSKI